MWVIAHLVLKAIYFKSLCGNRSDRCAPIVQTIERLPAFPRPCILGRTTPPVCDPNGLIRAVYGRAPKPGY